MSVTTLKRKRSPRYSSVETNELLDAMLRNKEMLFGEVPKEQKDAAWKNVTAAMYRVSHVKRSTHDVLTKYRNLKYLIRKNYMQDGKWKSTSIAHAEVRKMITLIEYNELEKISPLKRVLDEYNKDKVPLDAIVLSRLKKVEVINTEFAEFDVWEPLEKDCGTQTEHTGMETYYLCENED